MTLAICVPVRDTVHAKFAYCLSELTSYLTRSNINYNLLFQNGSVLPEQRHVLVEAAISANCEQVLWLDSDMVFPKNLYHKLSSYDKNVVACTYSTRTKPYRSVAFVDNNYNEKLSASFGLHKVSSVGMGLMLVKTEVYKSLTKPWFLFEYYENYNSYLGEDIYFCQQLQLKGFDIYVDIDTSKQCYHLSTTEIGILDIHDF